MCDWILPQQTQKLGCKQLLLNLNSVQWIPKEEGSSVQIRHLPISQHIAPRWKMKILEWNSTEMMSQKTWDHWVLMNILCLTFHLNWSFLPTNFICTSYFRISSGNILTYLTILNVTQSIIIYLNFLVKKIEFQSFKLLYRILWSSRLRVGYGWQPNTGNQGYGATKEVSD